MRRVILTIAASVVGLVLLLSFKTHPLTSAAASPPAVISTPATGSAAAPSASAGSTLSVQPSTPATTTPSPTKTTAPSTAKRTIQGDAVDTRYGAVQVAVTLSGNTITDVTVVQIPDREQRDVEINNYAAPILRQEALAAQSSKIDMVSGATYTSAGYQQSLQSALDKA